MDYSANRQKLLTIVKSEELARRLISYNEIIKLSHIFLDEIKAYRSSQLSALKEGLLASFIADHQLIDLVNSISKENAEKHHVSFSLATNRLKFILSKAAEILANSFADITSKHFLELYPANIGKLGPGDVKINAWPSYYQTLLLKALSLIHQQKISELAVLKARNIYQMEFSPNLASTALSTAFLEQPLEFLAKLKAWNFFYQDAKSPAQGELLLPHIGYVFGGVREDERYLEKAFRPEDCSSAIEKWVSLKQGEFSTLEMVLLALKPSYSEQQFARLLADPQAPPSVPANFPDAESALVALPQGTTPEPGMIFAFRNFNLSEDPEKKNLMATKGGHTGIVVETTKTGFLSLTYKRKLEEENVEGLVLQEEIIDPASARNYYFFDAKAIAEDRYSEILRNYHKEGNLCAEIVSLLNQHGVINLL